MATVRGRFGKLFGYEKIPLMDERGTLYYKEEEEPPQVVRVGGGFVMRETPSMQRKNSS